MKRIFRLVSCLLFVAVFAACTRAQATQPSAPPTSPADQEPVTEQAAAATTEAPAPAEVKPSATAEPASVNQASPPENTEPAPPEPQQPVALEALLLDHETGDFSQYTDQMMDVNSVEVTRDAALAGSEYGMAVNLTGINDMAFAYKLFDEPSTSGVFRARFYIDPNGIARTPGLGGNTFLYATSGSQWLGGISFGMNEEGTSHEVYATMQHDNDGHRETRSREISDGPHLIEAEWRRATSPTASDGSFSLWVDGEFHNQQTGLDNYDVWQDVGAVALGATANIPKVSIGTYYLDELAFNDTGEEIGPVR